jgi:E3 ubiquitin-protein ligase ATL41
MPLPKLLLPSPNDDRDHGLVVVLTLAIFFCFVVLYLVVGIICASVVTAFAVALSLCYFRARRRAALRRSTAVVVSVHLATRSNGTGLDHLDPAVLPAFAYKREGGGGGGDAGTGSGWAQCVI